MRSALLLVSASLLPVLVMAQSTQPPKNGTSPTATPTAVQQMVVYSGKTTNAKAVTWDDPVAVDGRVVRVRDLWALAAALSAGTPVEQHPHNQEMRTEYDVECVIGNPP